MITPEALKKKALRPWSDGSFLRAWLTDESLFPMPIRFAAPSGKKLITDFSPVRDWIHTLQKNSKASRGYGYRVDFKAINHRQLGQQSLPHRIYFETAQDWLQFIGRQTAFADFKRLAGETRQRQPKLVAFLSEKPLTALDHQAEWAKLLTICEWFAANPRPDMYMRQLDIPEIDTKFIETRKKLLTMLLDRVLAPNHIDSAVTGLSKHGFERRFGLKYDPPLVRLRLLDDRLAIRGLTDLCLPAADAVSTDFGAATVFITENKINGLSFPPVAGAVIIFGLGYGIKMLSEMAWLKDKTIYYWGDIDTHGFAILSQVRNYFPQTQSFLMDSQTLLQHQHLWGTEAASKGATGQLPNLTNQEAALFADLTHNRWGDRIRLEQEHIAYSRLLRALENI